MGSGESKEVLDFQNKKGNFNLLNDDINLFSSSGIVLFYLVVGGNYIAELLSCRLQHSFSDQISLKHLLGFLTLLFFVVMGQPNYTAKYSMWRIIGQSLLLYAMFVMSTKSESGCFIFSLLCFVITYFLELAIRTQADGLVAKEAAVNNLQQQIKNLRLEKLLKKDKGNFKKEESDKIDKQIKEVEKKLSYTDTNGKKTGALVDLNNYKDKIGDIKKGENDKKISGTNKLKYTQMVLTFVGIGISFLGFLSYMGAKKFEYGKHFNVGKFIFGRPSCSGASPPLPGHAGSVIGGLLGFIKPPAPGVNKIKEQLPKTGQIVKAIKYLAKNQGIKQKDIFNIAHADNIKEAASRVEIVNRFNPKNFHQGVTHGMSKTGEPTFHQGVKHMPWDN